MQLAGDNVKDLGVDMIIVAVVIFPIFFLIVELTQ